MLSRVGYCVCSGVNTSSPQCIYRYIYFAVTNVTPGIFKFPVSNRQFCGWLLFERINDVFITGWLFTSMSVSPARTYTYKSLVQYTRAGELDYNGIRTTFSRRCRHNNLPVTARAWNAVDGEISRNLFIRNNPNGIKHIDVTVNNISVIYYMTVYLIMWPSLRKQRNVSVVKLHCRVALILQKAFIQEVTGCNAND